ncbi:hypothetical protein SDRG_15053 [Saprolegnia diclina VS20]|uniref:Cyclic nucleotide-binding domain-containing protein n=1 Tax=Saprolegnia diclina (strain VS20) TaxID=1156394 RepID=T0Q1A3_SAPDV|nr:hypothetical protein SDRG_15053 [Saprolegnia diclina VS20]EQC27150.1 hypothetical protein SDRG_15053 [Saprolegnia diclina VS20]|eukprot:XP_008619436.1 hypothetical protein SDRG_15053 [Saprolegnia diclina VS20]
MRREALAVVRATLMNKTSTDAAVSLKESEDQFLFLQALRRRPISRHHVALHNRGVAHIGDDRPITTPPDASDMDVLSMDRNSMMCKAVVILWRHHVRMRAWRKWTLVAAAETKRLRELHLRQLRDEAMTLLRQSSPTSSFDADTMATLLEWAKQLHGKIFQDVSHEQLQDIVSHMTLQHVPCHECLFLEGDIGHGYYVLLSGAVSIYVGMPATTTLRLVQGRFPALEAIRHDPALLGVYKYDILEGDGFGEVAMFSNERRRTASALASRACDVVEIPKEVYDRTLRKAQLTAYRTAQAMAFLPTVDIFADWVHAKLATLFGLLDRRQVSFGQHLLTQDKPITGVYFILSGQVHLVQSWTTPASDVKPSTTLPITVDTVGRRGIVGIQSLVEPLRKRSKYAALAASDSVECFAVPLGHLDTFRGLLQSSNLAHLRDTWHALEAARAARFEHAISVLQTNTTALPPKPTPVAPETPGWTPKLRFERDKGPATLPQMTSLAGKKFVFHDFDLLATKEPTYLASSSLPKMTHVAKPPLRKDECAKVAALHLRAFEAHLWDTAPKASPTKPDDVRRPERPPLPPFARSLATTRLKARAVAAEHTSFTKARRVVHESLLSYKHAF